MKSRAILMAGMMGIAAAFDPKQLGLKVNQQKQKIFLVKNKNGTRTRDITAKVNYQNSSHIPHQGKQECARRVRQGLAA